MISLFLNTSSSNLSIAVFSDNKLIGSFYEKLDKDLSRVALAKIKEVLDSLSIEPQMVTNIYCVNGPGSFTGLRVGVTIAKTFAFFLKKELYPVSSLYAMAASYKTTKYIVPIIDARRGYVFAGIYNSDLSIVMEDKYILFDELCEKLSSLGDYVFVSDISIDFTNTEIITPDFERIINCYCGDKVDANTFVPVYLKKTEAEENLNK